MSLDAASLETFDDTQLNEWLTKRILQLSVDALSQRMVVCTACGETKGDYIIDVQKAQYRFDTPKTYAFLKYILAEG